MSRILCGLLVALAVFATPAPPARAQVTNVVLGGATGLVAGATVTLSVVVARARFQHQYMESMTDLIHWQSLPMIAAPATGVLFGLAGDNALRGSVAGSTSGLLVGAAAGAGLGWLLSEQEQWPWAGGVIGAGAGLALGGIVGGLAGWAGEETPGLEFPKMLRFGYSVPAP